MYTPSQLLNNIAVIETVEVQAQTDLATAAPALDTKVNNRIVALQQTPPAGLISGIIPSTPVYFIDGAGKMSGYCVLSYAINKTAI